MVREEEEVKAAVLPTLLQFARGLKPNTPGPRDQEEEEHIVVVEPIPKEQAGFTNLAFEDGMLSLKNR
jgi:hypothetical protein